MYAAQNSTRLADNIAPGGYSTGDCAITNVSSFTHQSRTYQLEHVRTEQSLDAFGDQTNHFEVQWAVSNTPYFLLFFKNGGDIFY